MSFVDVCLMASLLVVVVIVARMLRAVRLLDRRVTLLQEQLSYGRTGRKPPTELTPAPHVTRGKTPIAVVSMTPAPAISRHTPVPVVEPSVESGAPGEEAAVVIDQGEADAIWARLEAEEERLRKAMGRDFQGRTRKRSGSEVRGRPVVRAMSSREIARKLERK
jgi:hypothetical protein